MRLSNIYVAIFRPRISIGVFLFACILLALCTWYYTSREPLNRKPGGKEIAPLGTLLYTDQMAIKVEKVREDKVGAPPFTPRDGNTFIIPTFSVTNISDTQHDLIPTLTIYLKDSDGNIYSMAAAPIENEGFGGPMLPHDTVRQEMAFEVKKDAKNLTLYFEAGGKVMAENLGIK